MKLMKLLLKTFGSLSRNSNQKEKEMKKNKTKKNYNGNCEAFSVTC